MGMPVSILSYLLKHLTTYARALTSFLFPLNLVDQRLASRF